MPPIDRRRPLTPTLSPGGGEGCPAASGRRIGLLGGSFNPAHGGHLHISRLALRRLDLDEVWWLVSPQNPLKPAAGMAPFDERLRAGGRNRRRRPPHPGHRHRGPARRTTYTADTLQALRRRFPRTRFVWLMGGDNLAQFPYWRRWQDIFRTVPIAVFARPGTSSKALAGAAAHRFAARARAGHGGASAGRDDPAGLGVFPYPPRPAIGHADPGRSLISSTAGEKTRRDA